MSLNATITLLKDPTFTEHVCLGSNTVVFSVNETKKTTFTPVMESTTSTIEDIIVYTWMRYNPLRKKILKHWFPSSWKKCLLICPPGFFGFTICIQLRQIGWIATIDEEEAQNAVGHNALTRLLTQFLRRRRDKIDDGCSPESIAKHQCIAHKVVHTRMEAEIAALPTPFKSPSWFNDRRRWCCKNWSRQSCKIEEAKSTKVTTEMKQFG